MSAQSDLDELEWLFIFFSPDSRWGKAIFQWNWAKVGQKFYSSKSAVTFQNNYTSRSKRGHPNNDLC